MNKKIIKITSSLLLATMVAYTTPILAFTKEETVYSKTKSNGETYQTIVSTHLKNGDEENILKDLTDLIDIENMNGDETFLQNGEELIWNANGSDIYYQGESKKELPVKCKISYELDGEEILAEDLAGKSGNVKITIEYENLDSHEVYINGRKETMYTPFTVACGTIFANTENKNIEITNGKIVNDGTKTMVLGIAMPGMSKSLNISNKTIDIPDKVEITMQTTNFEQNNIITFITPKIFDKSFSFDKLNEIYNKVDTLQSSSKEIEEGANALKEGTEEFSEKSQEFNSAMKQIEAGTSTINENYSKIDSGINSVASGSKELETGAKNLSDGLNALSEGISSMPESINKLYQGSVSAAAGLNDNTQTNEAGLVTGVNSLANSLSDTISSLEESLETMKNSCEEGITKLSEVNNALNSVIDSLSPTEDAVQIGTLQTVVKGNEDAIKEYKAKINYINASLEDLNTKKAQGEKSIAKVTQGMKELQTGVNTLSGGLKQLNDAASTLPENLNKLNEGSKALAEGSNNLVTGTNTLAQGSKSLKAGMQSLNTNTKKLTLANNELTSATITLKEGACELANGITTFNEEAINKICNYINSDIKDIAQRAEKLQELSEEYVSFTKASEDTAKDVKFILITDSIKVKKDDENSND